ncbi:DUF2846 domain-containing protein [Sphingomonas bisphenolicum]|uniref:DUF2846 domain-containing protein n=1 Tax=Sphingomonas bisphenolicum TaxID=296544 RepID=A0ABM7G5T0_9SPHN|nr:DUF2846 domain-containing protein [Sphingomonas bisphenolicum]BBF70781.1 hypothetical protein SBA_ch1_29810 [Sphingomonas bisphenolicum]
MKSHMVLALVALGCATSAVAQDAPADPVAPAVAAAPASDIPAGKGKIVFFRKGGLMGAAISCAVHEKGERLTSLPPGKFAVLYAEPGIHEYSVKSEATDTLRLEIEPGETYYSKCNIQMGIMAGRPNLSPSDKAGFDAISAKLKPVEIKAE